jgi:hypothetical protein
MLGSDSPIEAGGYPIANSFDGVTGDAFAGRLTPVINTLWQASMAPFSLALGASADFAAPVGSNGYFPSSSTVAITNTEITVYSTNVLFVTLLLIITLILQACAIAGLILKYTVTAPDILGYVSTMTRDNKFAAVPQGGTALDGLERATHLREMKVQIADVLANHANGHIALRSVEKDVDFARGRLSTYKLYM